MSSIDNVSKERGTLQLDKLEYCRKFYPTTEKVIEYKKEFDNNWKNGGNSGSFQNTLMSCRCVLSGESI
jgi:hypothetical protein